MKRTTIIILGVISVCTLTVAAVGFAFNDRFSTAHSAPLSTRAIGDPQLTEALASNAPEGAHNLAGFVINHGETRFGGLGADQDTEFEVGSITKTFNVELLRILSERGEVSPQIKVGEIINATAPICDITLEELANHTSGLPRLAGIPLWKLIWSGFAETNPYENISAADIVDLASKQQLKNRGTEQYSNYGAALLGQLLAIKAGSTWPELVEKEILTPLGMRHTYVATFGRVPDNAPVGLNEFGRPAAVWEMEGYAPAGAIRSTAQDMEKYTRYLLDKGVPDYGWQVDAHGVWHNGATAGFSTQLRIDSKNQRAAYVANDTETTVDELPDAMLNAFS
ncbi:serine hydrolase domain-containing protein [Corynebacterium lactis]|uniref:Beta-lactamase n=1 Tax=Corynebacterium lactis RW2-5 TaxID=1408189 RepID=A0A0K2H1V1_9CORY|nr:serine hydrolase domain-containing protein [Corynebacterium lactis]ALA68009.1 beta-lactamase [Corynebacterium lactis RW2-5]